MYKRGVIIRHKTKLKELSIKANDLFKHGLSNKIPFRQHFYEVK